MFPILQLGPLALQVPGLVLVGGVWLGLALAERRANRLAALGAAGRLTAEAVYQLAWVGLLTGLVGARLAYAGRYLEAYLADPLGLVSPSPATLAVPEGVLLGLTAAVIYSSRRRLPLRPTLEALAPALAGLGVALALAHAASGDAFGAPTSVPWRIWLWDEYRHPSQLYELAGALAVLGAWAIWTRTERGQAGTGLGFLLVVGLSAAARVFLEAFRGDSALLANGMRAAQTWSLLAVAACLALAPAAARPEAGPEPAEPEGQ
jgi:prolipoprotein diacylglyceryltransferase